VGARQFTLILASIVCIDVWACPLIPLRLHCCAAAIDGQLLHPDPIDFVRFAWNERWCGRRDLNPHRVSPKGF
jgi:hypothetical protein